MKKTRIIVAVLLVLCALLGLCACSDDKCTMHTDKDGDGKCDKCGATVEEEPPCTEHTDADTDGKCDKCGATMATSDTFELITDGKANFQLVICDGAPSALRRKVDSFVSDMKKLGITVTAVESNGTEQNCEVLLGTITTRGDEYNYDRYTLGDKGYVIKAVGSKIIVNGGSDEMLAEAFEKFAEDFVGLTKNAKSDDLQNVAVESDKWIEKFTEYRVTGVTVAGEDLKGYTIARDQSNKAHRDAAKSLQDALYTKAGYYLPIVSLEEASEKSIVIRHAEKSETTKGFTVKVSGKSLLVLCAYENKFEESFEKFLNTIKLVSKGELTYAKNYKLEYEISKVYYADFGAKGDGITNDFLAMKATHDYANEGGQSVYGQSGAKYYIGSTLDENGKAQSITIKTNTDWQGATIIIDDNAITTDGEKALNIFNILSDANNDSFTADMIAEINASGAFTRETTKIGTGLGYPAMLTIYNDNHKMYIRYGGNQNSGNPQSEIIVIDENGNVDPTTPFLFDYDEVTRIHVHRLDVEPITVQNAKIISKANETNLKGAYLTINRGIGVQRPNTTIQYIDHSIENEGVKAEGFTGHSYGGIISVSNTSNVDVIGCTLQSRVYYVQGTYEISAARANDVVFKDCVQSNFWTDENKMTVNMSLCWGVSGTNYCKNLVYDHSTLTRYDAHCGVVNGKIINGSEVSAIRLIGGGEFLIEDSTIYTYSKSIIQLREDYGATFDGTVIIRNSTITGTGYYKTPTEVFGAPSANHDFGYTTHFPDLVMDNVAITGLKRGDKLNISNTLNTGDVEGEYYRAVTDATIGVAGAISADGKPNVNPYVAPSSIKVINNTKNGYTLVVWDVPFFAETELEGATRVPYTGN